MQRFRLLRSSALFGLLSVAACGGDAVIPDAATVPAPDAAMTPSEDAFVVANDAFVSSEDAPPATTDAPSAGGGSMTGVVTRSAMPAAGGRGDLYIALFTTDPVTDRMGARRVADARIENVDMSAAGARIPYTVSGIPPRSEPYFVTAFLDDNDTVDPTDPSRAGPDRGDLVALMGFSSLRVTVSGTGTVTQDIDLNFNLPF
jgi:hypothetical protein